MKSSSTLVCLFFIIATNSFTLARAQVNTTDSLALVDLYNSTNGPNWGNHTNWLTSQPVSSWFGITVTGNRVTTVFIYNNNMTGTIPSSIGNLTALTILKLYTNHLSGPIPSSIGNLVNLFTLYLNNNQLSGAIPSSIGNLVHLDQLDLDANQLSDSIPSTIGNMASLTGLILNENQLSGTIPASIGNLVNLDFLDLSNNQLSGTLPTAITTLTLLFYLSLSHNQLTGTIPSSIGDLINLASLYLDNNRLKGSIPSSVGNLVSIQDLYLNDNKLTGKVPKALFQLPQLYYLYLNNNHLTQSKNILPGPVSNIPRGSIGNNDFTFDGLEFIAATYPKIRYQPQAKIPVHQNGNTLSVSAGGTLSNNTYHWYKAGSTDSTVITGDSVFTPLQTGVYYVKVTNAIATTLTLRSDSVNFVMRSIMANNHSAAGLKSSTRLTAYPNPAMNTIYTQTAGAATTLTLTNSNGKILLTQSIRGNGVIDVSRYTNGVYYLQNITTGEVQKIVVVH